MVDPVLFISLMIVAATELIKKAAPSVQDWLTIIVAFIIGVVVALVDTHIGLPDISIAQGIQASLGAIGLSVLAKKAAG